MTQQQPQKTSSEIASSIPEFTKYRNIYQTHELPDAHKTVDGKFKSYSTLKHLPDEEKALKLLRTLACIVAPVMSHHKIVAHALHERIYDPNCDIIGINYVRKDNQGTYIRSADTGLYTSIVLSITLRRHKDPSKFYTLEELLDILCHELAHCWHIGHEFNFQLQWASLVREVENDVGGKLQIKRAYRDSDGQRRLIGWMPAGRMEPLTRKPSNKVMHAAFNWEKDVWGFDDLRKSLDEELVQKVGTRGVKAIAEEQHKDSAKDAE